MGDELDFMVEVGYWVGKDLGVEVGRWVGRNEYFRRGCMFGEGSVRCEFGVGFLEFS